MFKVSPHLAKLAGKSQAIKKQFYPSFLEGNFSNGMPLDPFKEDTKYRKMKGLVCKYPGRALVLLTNECASYCRFCTRRRRLLNSGSNQLSKKEIDKICRFLKNKRAIKEVIFSGGDPLVCQRELDYFLSKISKFKHIKIIRMHTRAPISAPALITKKTRAILKKTAGRALYALLHFNHPDEITAETERAIKILKQSNAMLLSQSVFLSGINDSYNTLSKLFNRLIELQVKPYMIGHCDMVRGIEHFIVPIEKEISIMTKLRKNISGIAFPKHVIDAPNGYGKIPVPQNFWKFDRKKFKDFNGKEIEMY